MKKFTILLTAIFLIINLSACGNDLSDKNFRKLMGENGYDSSFSDNVTVIDSIDLNSNVKGLNGNNKLVLIKNTSNNRYGLTAVDLNSRTITDCSFGYSPLNIIMLKIFESNEDTNIKNLKKVAEYINTYSYDCFNDQDIAESYIRDITDVTGIISTSVAQKAIEDSLSYIFPDIAKAEDYAVIFEDGNANPVYYAALEKTMVYRLSSIIPESHYKLLDRQTQNNISAIYGAPYTLTNVWAVVDKNMNKVGTFNSLDDAKNQLAGKLSEQSKKDISPKKSGTTIIYKINAEKINNELTDSIKELINFRLIALGYDDASVNIKNSNNVYVVFSNQIDDIESVSEQLKVYPAIKFEDYNGNVLLDSSDIENVVIERTHSENSADKDYCVSLKLNEKGRANFKKATANISEYESPNNTILIMIDESVISSPRVNKEIDSDSVIISGSYTKDDAIKLENQIKSAINPFTLEVIDIH